MSGLFYKPNIHKTYGCTIFISYPWWTFTDKIASNHHSFRDN